MNTDWCDELDEEELRRDLKNHIRLLEEIQKDYNKAKAAKEAVEKELAVAAHNLSEMTDLAERLASKIGVNGLIPMMVEEYPKEWYE